ncbi:MAG: hypothetical protein QOI65_1099 [Thermoleophilaceae bacterium]|nr:hypothetical protein [Thermoleophilaceae bacterium]
MSSTILNPPDQVRAREAGLLDSLPVVDERGARRALMGQIARLEADLGALTEPATAEPDRPRRAQPRLLSLSELEEARDRLAERIRVAQLAAGEIAERQEEFRMLREEMLLDPDSYRHVRVTNADIGEPGCLDWHVRPRFGVLGMLMRWWRVRISSGCP